MCQITNCTVTAIGALLNAIEDHPNGLEDLRRIVNMQNMCPQLFTDNKVMKMLYIGVERNIIQNIMNNSFSGDSVSYNLQDLSMTVDNLTNLTSANGNIIQIKAPEILIHNGTYIPETWIPTDAFQGIAEDQRKVSVVIYKPSNQFVFNNTVLITPVMRIEALGGILKNLNNPLMMKFQLLDPDSTSVNYSASCQYFNEYGNVSISNNVFWETDGCQTKINGNLVECSCNHATPFAVLLIPNMPYDDNNWQILSYITYIGCGLSAFFTALSLITYVFTRNRSVDHANAIHISLSGALFLLNSFFILNEWVASLGINGVCIFIAVAIHYSLLSSFTWMAIEAVHLYILLVKVFNIYYRHYMVKLSVIGWGVPGVVVGISLAFQNTQHFYGSTVTTLANSNKTNTICWITNITFFYGVNLGYFTFTFVMNSGILLTVTTRICQLKCLDNKHKAGKGSLVFKDVCTVLGLTCLLGVTWGLAFLSIGYYNLVILYLFTIFNSLQGFFIFLWICGSVRKERELAAKTKSTAVAMNTSVAKSKEGFSEGNNPYQ
ncbi:adhesion G-protein coupled receptor G2-like [Esox lucius]|nr:adhesion G-protein coupled receptor G2-like [Esox lucius]